MKRTFLIFSTEEVINSFCTKKKKIIFQYQIKFTRVNYPLRTRFHSASMTENAKRGAASTGNALTVSLL